MDDAWRAELAELIAIPSVSADPAHREDVKRAGEWVCELIRRIGVGILREPGNDSARIAIPVRRVKSGKSRTK